VASLQVRWSSRPLTSSREPSTRGSAPSLVASHASASARASVPTGRTTEALAAAPPSGHPVEEVGSELPADGSGVFREGQDKPPPSVAVATNGSVARKATGAPSVPPSLDPNKVARSAPPDAPSDASLFALMKEAVGAADATVRLVPVERAEPPSPVGSPATILHPSQGQVASALGAVLPQARACFDSDDPISRARVVFRPSGDVQSVAVTGYAQGKPTEACVRSALSEAKVPPFTEAAFVVPVTIRP
jgi:hypothetical protein